MSNPINTAPLSQFAQILRAAELSQSKEVKMSIQQARLLGLALIEIQERINQDYETMFNSLKGYVGQEQVSIEVDGGGFDTK